MVARILNSYSQWDMLVCLIFNLCLQSSQKTHCNIVYAACFLGALQLQAARHGQKEAAEKAKVSAKVYLGHPEDPTFEGFGIRAEIIVENFDDDAVIQAAHEVRPKQFLVSQYTYAPSSFAPIAVLSHTVSISKSPRLRYLLVYVVSMILGSDAIPAMANVM